MTQKVYFRPTGLVAANRSREATGFSGALPLCGNGPFDFLGLEIARRNSSKIERRAVSLAEVWESDVRAEYLAGADLLDRLTRPRRRLLGLAPDRPHLMGVINVTPDSFSA